MNFIDLDAQQKQINSFGKSLRQEIDLNISKVLNHGKYILGPEVEELEKILNKFVGTDECVVVSSGTDALLLSLLALGLKKGDEVITTAFSFISTAEVIDLIGLIPRFVDIKLDDYNLDPEKVEGAINSKTRAIIPVSLYGQPANFEEINSIASKYNLPVIEDAAQSFGSSQNGKRSCNLSTIGVTSFFPSKPFGCYGDGGACFTNDKSLAEKIRRLSRHGQIRRYVHKETGINGRLDTIQAAILIAKFPYFENEIKKRQEVANRYTKKLNEQGFNATPNIMDNNTSVFAQYTVRVKNREIIQAKLSEKNIPSSVHYPMPLPEQPSLRKFKQFCPNTKKASEEVLSLPMHPFLTEKQQNFIVENLIRISTLN